MQFPRPCVAPNIRIVGIATFVDAVEHSLNRIACETAPRMCARRTRGPDSPPPDRWAAYPRAPARTRARSCVPGQRRPRAFREVDVRIKGVTAHIQRFACEQHTMSETVLPKTQTTTPIRAHRQHFSPRWSALWAPHCPEPRPQCPEPRPHHPEPRPHRHQTGGIAALGARHAGDTTAGCF